MKLSGLTKMVKRQLVCNVFHNDESDDFYIGTASAIYCATGFPRPLNRNQMGAMLGISEDTMIEKVVYNDFDCAYKIDFQGFNLDDTIKDEVEVKKLGIGIYCSGEILIPLVTEDRHMVGIICQSHLAPLEDEIKNNGFIRYYQRKTNRRNGLLCREERHEGTSRRYGIYGAGLRRSKAARTGCNAGRNSHR